MPSKNPTEQGKAAEVHRALLALANPAKAKILQGFFKTGPGQYGEGDLFLGVTVPQVRAMVKGFAALPLRESEALLHSELHEERLCALLFMVRRFEKSAEEPGREAVYRCYLKNLKWINNWDLVDLSAPNIVGTWLLGKDQAILDAMIASKHLWTKRVAMLATFAFIRQGDAKPALRLAAKLLGDKHDLMHKASGWMLREAGKRVDVEVLRGFLRKNAARMPRTMLRYAIERLPEAERRRWMTAGR